MTEPSLRAELRSRGRAVRRSLTGAERDDAERSLLAHLTSLLRLRNPRPGGGGVVGLFSAHDGEPDLMPLATWLRDRGTAVALPIVSDDPSRFDMSFVTWPRGVELVTGRYGIAVPPTGPAVVPDVTLVSCVSFDTAGNRIGRGAGYFDRYLAASPTVAVGVAFERQRAEWIPAEAHDVAMRAIVTDLGVRFPPSGAGTSHAGTTVR